MLQSALAAKASAGVSGKGAQAGMAGIHTAIDMEANEGPAAHLKRTPAGWRRPPGHAVGRLRGGHPRCWPDGVRRGNRPDDGSLEANGRILIDGTRMAIEAIIHGHHGIQNG